jgi:hypothetical protein
VLDVKEGLNFALTVSDVVFVTILSRKVWFTLHGIFKLVLVVGNRMFPAFSRLLRHFVNKFYLVHWMKMAG